MREMKILAPGLLTTVQDSGRRGMQKLGVPVAGAMDLFSAELANVLVGNRAGEPVLEMTFSGLKAEMGFEGTAVYTGAGFTASSAGVPVERNRPFAFQCGDIIDMGFAREGVRGYLAVAGGFETEKIMGSCSTYLRGKLGGFRGRALAAGDVLTVGEPEGPVREITVPGEFLFAEKEVHELRVLPASEEDAFTTEGLETFYGSVYGITPASDRMGYRLEGLCVEHRGTADIISSGLNMGAVQIPGDGKPIVMMADRQPTGGYTKVANVISADLPVLSQLGPGAKVKFRKIPYGEAREASLRRSRFLTDAAGGKTGSAENFRREYRITVNGVVYHVTAAEKDGGSGK